MNVRDILDRYHIHYLVDGKNTKRGSVSIKCPVCGMADPSEHGNVSLHSGFFSCWRNRQHAMSFRRLITMMVGREAAEGLADDDAPAPEGYDAAVAALFANDSDGTPAATSRVAEVIDWPREVREISPTGSTRPYWDYLRRNRKIPEGEIVRACDVFDLRCAPYGRHTCRILFPIHDWQGNMIAFYGRAITPARMRYKAEPPGPQSKWGLFGLPQAKRGGRRLIINEGPFDALNLNIYAPRDCHAVSVQTTSITPQQKVLINRLAERYDEVVVMLDQQAEEQALAMTGQLILPTRMVMVPEHRKDPGEMNDREAALAWNC